ncbi:MAG: hypothetical protein KA972_03620 [Brachymonas sp.]|nr:hypothetical protein [Brachymonas sp.]
MPEIIRALAQLMGDLVASDAVSGAPRAALENALAALEHLNEDPAELAELREAVAYAQAKGIATLDGVPVSILAGLLLTTEREQGGSHDE